ncbi:MAG: DUF3365 domain-containing protein [Candidatus Marinimicrobia bacterium]|nr:DUF3365 domain-containing protein [Candidatus Neomarinimicrobiota bacterium]MBL7023506.1 DUF3365 domain-containing protein [Candidatus Neomarinimicrobiota bacterium]MBL7109535.1 DUF3365 domain-containing protein [Candidatus Neomarinimicrobiota bacterium]
MRLTTKIILIVGLLVTSIISVIFSLLILRVNRQSEESILTTARAIKENVLITRKWISDHDGVLVKKKPGMEPSIFLPHPELITSSGDTLLLKNPALVTRELSELSDKLDGDFSYHMASEKYINPENKPDHFEQAALNFYSDSLLTDDREYFQIEEISGRHYFRYFTPLYTQQSCLSCHAYQGYEVGDIRGGISILLSINSYLNARSSNVLFLIGLGGLSIGLLGVLIFIAIRKSVIHPLRQIEDSAQALKDDNYHLKLPISSNDEIGSLARTLNDMSSRINTFTKKLKDSEKKYHSLIEKSLEAVAITLQNGTIIESNPKLSYLTGYNESDLHNCNFSDLIDIEKIHHISDISNSDSEHFEAILLTKESTEKHVEIYKIKGLSLGEAENLTFIYIRDISERKQIEKYAIQTEKMFALGQLSSGIAHEIRNPLFALNNNLDYLNKNLNSDEFDEIYPELQDSVTRIHKIVTTILDYSKPHKPEFKSIDIRESIKKSLSLVKKQYEKSSIRIDTKFHDEISQIEADSHQLEQVFLNLMMNAMNAMGNAGTLTIESKLMKNHIKISIQDTGIGIETEELDRIYDPFYSTFTNGTGLGLAIVQRILEQHNAKYYVESEKDFGTTFFIFLPHKQGLIK